MLENQPSSYLWTSILLGGYSQEHTTFLRLKLAQNSHTGSVVSDVSLLYRLLPIPV